MDKLSFRNRFKDVLVVWLVLFTLLLPVSPLLAYSFTRDLSLGSKGQDVLELQKTLNKATETRLADNGAGSPGLETDYFGPLTKAAVTKYQELHKESVLAPLGLLSGTGYFGPSTRARISQEEGVDYVSKYLDISKKGPTDGGQTINANELIDTTRNNLEEALVGIRSEGEKQGFSSSHLDQLEVLIREEVAGLDESDISEFIGADQNTTPVGSVDYLLNSLEVQGQELEDLGVRGAANLQYGDPLPPALLFAPFIRLASALKPESAYAQTGLFDFGGNLYFFVPCTCPPGPVFMYIRGSTIVTPVWLLDYIPGTQIKLAFNLPLPKVDLTGKWTPFAVRACWFGVPPACFPAPSVGLITPLVGSGLIPKPSF